MPDSWVLRRIYWISRIYLSIIIVSFDICHRLWVRASRNCWSWLTRSNPQGQSSRACSKKKPRLPVAIYSNLIVIWANEKGLWINSKVLYPQHQELIRISCSAVCLTMHNILFAIIINGEWRQISFVGNAFFAHGYTHQALSDDTFGIEHGFITRHTVGQQFH